MHIKHVEIANFRKLQSVRIDFSDEKTIFVGANNSGKTSAMVALRKFLVDASDFSINDFTLPHWAALNSEAEKWELAAKAGEPIDPLEWSKLLPHLDVWLQVDKTELHYVQKLLPTLDFTGGILGVRLRFEPKDAVALQREYLKARAEIAATLSAKITIKPSAATEQAVEMVVEVNPAEAASADDAVAAAGVEGHHAGPAAETQAFVVSLWPQSMTHFIERKIRTLFSVEAYLLDPAKLTKPVNGLAVPQSLDPENEPLGIDPFKGLICIDEISAQRGFGFSPRRRSSRDADSDQDRTEASGGRKLSTQLRSYYTNHLDPYDKPEPKDLAALAALETAQAEFEKRLQEGFAEALKELEELGYPGVTDPKLRLSTRIRPTDGLNHEAAVQYEVPTHDAALQAPHRLPEDSNGLGYQNLVSMVFGLMSFRDKWMKVGKAGMSADDEAFIPPLHLVLIEEPEAHLHAQVQQVFIKQAYAVLRKHQNLGASAKLKTQLVVSTHSSHVAHECDFAALRYFRRLPAPAIAGSVPIASVVNLSEVFGGTDQTDKFVTRYLKATHCDLFFADGAILVEGPAERILVPHFVHDRDEYKYLRRSYITWLEIGGSHSHRLRELIEHLGLTTLIITDLDAQHATTTASVVPKRGENQRTRNHTVKSWVPVEQGLDALLDLGADAKVKIDASGYAIRVAYQTPVKAIFKSAEPIELLPNTFEDSLLYENISLFESLTGVGIRAGFIRALAEAKTAEELAEKAAATLSGNSKKAEFALDLLYDLQTVGPPPVYVADLLKVPSYIDEGLVWLASELKRKEDDITGAAKAAA
jgi:predicted ATP-dependent endonuclease of OLD family